MWVPKQDQWLQWCSEKHTKIGIRGELSKTWPASSARRLQTNVSSMSKFPHLWNKEYLLKIRIHVEGFYKWGFQKKGKILRLEYLRSRLCHLLLYDWHRIIRWCHLTFLNFSFFYLWNKLVVINHFSGLLCRTHHPCKVSSITPYFIDKETVEWCFLLSLS